MSTFQNIYQIDVKNLEPIDQDLMIKILLGKTMGKSSFINGNGAYLFTSTMNVYNNSESAYKRRAAAIPDSDKSCLCTVRVATYANIVKSEVHEYDNHNVIILLLNIGSQKTKSNSNYGYVYFATYGKDSSGYSFNNENIQGGLCTIGSEIDGDNDFLSLDYTDNQSLIQKQATAKPLLNGNNKISSDQLITGLEPRQFQSLADIAAAAEKTGDKTLAEIAINAYTSMANNNGLNANGYYESLIEFKSNMPVNFNETYQSVEEYDAFVSDEASNGLKYSDLRGVFGAPYQFLPTTDCRYNSDGMSMDLGTAGYTFARKIGLRMPLLYITPGNSSFMGGSSKKEKKGFISSVFEVFSGNDEQENTLSDMLDDYTGKLYTITPAYSEYFNYVNPMCRMGAVFLGIEDETYNGVKLIEYNWGMYEGQAYEFYEEENSTDNSSDQEKKEESDSSNSSSKDTNYGEDGGFISWVGDKLDSISYTQSYIYYKNAIPFFINSETSFQDSFTNEVGDSTLASAINGLSDKAREIQFLMGTASSAVGKAFDNASKINAISQAKESIDNIVNKISNGNSIFSTLVNSVRTIVSGGRMIFPQIWQGAGFSRSYNISLRLTTPSYDPYSWWLNIYVPMCHLAGLVMPRSEYVNSYTAPFLVKAFYKGMFNIDMGIITEMQFTKGKDGGWTADSLPTVVEVSFTIQDLYSEIGMTSTGTMFKGFTLQNMCELDYFANLCGVNFNEPDISRMVKLWSLFQLHNIKDIPNRFGLKISNAVSNAMTNIYSNLWY